MPTPGPVASHPALSSAGLSDGVDPGAPNASGLPEDPLERALALLEAAGVGYELVADFEIGRAA